MKIHFLSNSLKTNSGFAIVTKNLALGLHKLGHEVSMTGTQTTVTPEHYKLSDTFTLECLPLRTNLNEGIQFQRNLLMTNPNVLIYVGADSIDENDPFELCRKFPRTLCYIPIEGSGIPNYMINDLNNVVKNGGKIIAQCNYGFNQMRNNNVNVDRYIYHGYDPTCFNKLVCVSTDIPDENIILTKYMDEKWTENLGTPLTSLLSEFKGKFVFLFVGQNHLLRKRIEILLEAFNIFLSEFPRQKRDRIHLHLHTIPQSPTGLRLLDYIELYKLNIKENISFSYGEWRSSGFTEQALNILYNLSDCQVSATSSEGFGLPILEGFATGLPMIAPDCTSLMELVGRKEENRIERGLLAKIRMEYTIQDLTKRSLVDVNDLANKMMFMYQNKEEKERYSNNAIEFAKKYTWDNICNQFNEVLKSMK